jgi:Carbohydrate binding domain
MSSSLRRWTCVVACACAVSWIAAFSASPAAASVDARQVSAAGIAPSPVQVPTQPSTLPFPRLAIMFPGRVQAPLDDVARFDWVRLSPHDAPIVPALKAINPSLMALPYVNSSEVSYYPSPDASPDQNDQLRQIPAQWLLTEVSASATSLHVDRVSVVIEGTSVMLFVPGDSVVMEGELAYVESVDAVNCVLTVRRGVVQPAAAHSAGTRIASTITDYPHTLVLDTSTYCPAITVDPAVGPETWGEYEARAVAGMMADAAWDGVYLDRGESTQSWLIKPNCARTIDPDRSNTTRSDYSAFDAAWADGIRLYERRVRDLVGVSRIVLANCGMPNYDLLNGNVLESFPDDSGTWYSKLWRQALFGPLATSGSYFEWMANAQQPNLTTILTYENDGRPDQNDPTPPPGFVPNYRKMRFGLCTALLNDGFFSYDLHSYSTLGSLNSVWFDEYDNAGRDPGYLGQALGPPRRALGQLATPNLVSSGGFDTPADLSDWLLSQGVGYRGTVALDTQDRTAGAGAARIDISEAGGICWSLPFMLNQPVPITQGAEYTLSFWAKADRPRTVRPRVHRQTIPQVTWIDFRDVGLKTTWEHFEVSATAAGGAANGVLNLALGQSPGSVWFDAMELRRGGSDVWRRDFQGGVSLVNASTSSVTVPLGGVLRKIKGTQVPSLNDGRLVARVTLGPRDGLILLRPTISPQEIAIQAAGQAAAEWRRCVSLSARARDYYARLMRQSTGSRRLNAARSRLAWKRALTAAGVVRTGIEACQATLAVGDVASARNASDAARVAARRASVLVGRAWRLGHAGRSCAAAARSSAAVGQEELFTASAAVADLP